MYSGKDVWELGDFEGSTLKLCGTNNSNDILDGTTNTTNPIIHLYNGTSSYDLIVTIENLTIQNATKGAIKLQDEHSILKLGHGCVITKNKDDDDGCGGIYNGGTVCIYDNAIIGKNANLINTNATNAIANGGNSPHGIYGGNVWIGYTDPSLDALDNSGNTCQIAGNCFSGIEMTGGTLYLGKGNIHHNYRNNGGGGVYLEHFSTMYMSGGTINNNSTDGNGGGVYVSGTTSSEFTMSGGVIEQNTAVTGGAIYNAGHFNISGDASIPAGDEGKNDVYLVNTRFINIADSLNPPPAANGISATFTPETYSETTTYIYDDTHGATVEQKYEKKKVTPQSVTIGGVAKKIKWKTTETGKIVIPFSATINSESYSTVASLIEALTDSAGPFNNQDITLTLEGKVSADELGKATVEGTIAYAIQNTVSNSIKLVIPSEAIVKLNSDSSNIFYNCKKLISADLSGFDTSESEYFGTMFANCSILKTLDLSSFVTSSVKYMDSTFGNCPELETIYVSNTFTTTSVNNSTNMFYNCTKLKGGEGTAYNSSKIDKTYARIDYGSSNPGYFTSVNDKPIDVTEETVDEVFANLHSGDNVIRINGSLNSNYIKALRTKIQNASNSIVLDFTAISDSNYSISSRNGTSVDSTYGDSFQSCTMLTKIIVSNNHKIYFSANAFKNCAYLATIKVIDSFDNTDSSYKCDSGQEPFAGCIRLKTLDFTECTTVKLVGTKFTTTTNTQDNSYTTEVRFGKKLYTLNINNSVAFTNENFKFEYQGTKSNWQTVSKTRLGTQKDPLKCHCAEDDITLTMDSLGIWSE